MRKPDKTHLYEIQEFVNELLWIDTPEGLVKQLKDLYIAVCSVALSHDNLIDDTCVAPTELKNKLGYVLAIIDALELVKIKEVA